MFCFFFFKQKTAYEMRISDWSSDVCSSDLLSEGLKVITVTDQRWDRCDIKSVSLLPNILGKQAAVEAGAYEAWQVDGDGRVTEGTSTNAWIVTPDKIGRAHV